jgi:hypothetical protein
MFYCITISILQYKLYSTLLCRRGAAITQLSIVTVRSAVPGRSKRFFLLNLQIDCEVSCSIVIGVHFLRSKRPGRQGDYASLSSAEVKNEWSYTSSLSAWFHDVDKANLKIYFCIFMKSASHITSCPPIRFFFCVPFSKNIFKLHSFLRMRDKL